ncbi:hypothetical protein [Streptomyces sp. NPDC046631]|uniref:hypothetical protein n=1 Tax=unclassified Streptomyces TaxID=2593676 RepID=UPI003405B6FD
MPATSPVADGITFEPATYYSATVTDTNPDCENIGKTFDIAELYSNDGHIITVQCGLCSQLMTITSATRLNPQPEVM